VGEALGSALGHDHPLVVANAADVGALVEHTRGAAAGYDNVIYLHGDVGVGSGIIAGGRRVTGHGGYGGEAGHMVVNPHGRACGCGSRGCWETEIGEQALLERAGRAGATGRDAVLAVMDAALDGDGEAEAAIRHVADWLGFGVVNLVNIFNPNMVVFGGTLRELYLAGAAQVHNRLSTMALPGCRDHIRLRTPALGDDVPLMGAAELAFERLLEDPLVAGTG
jgi:predicted NBD/HSP70 family sugar kinase